MRNTYQGIITALVPVEIIRIPVWILPPIYAILPISMV
jgi:hypothetical protein